MGSLKEVQFSGCLGHHGQYSFYRNVKIDGRVLGLSSFFPVRIYPDSAIFSIAEVQLLWSDRAENFVSLRLYFLPENTPEGRLRHHGEDEVIALQDKVIIRASDLSSWLVDESEWDWGYVLPLLNPAKDSHQPLTPPPEQHPTRASPTDKFIKAEKNARDISETGSSRVVVLNYQRYVRVRTLLKRLEGTGEDVSNWLSDPSVLALGGLINIGPECRLLFSKEVFDYPELEDHELLCNHLAPKLKGRPRKRKRKRDRSVGSESNKSSSSTASACSSEVNKKQVNGIILPPCPVEIANKEMNSTSPKSVESEESQPSPIGLSTSTSGVIQIKTERPELGTEVGSLEPGGQLYARKPKQAKRGRKSNQKGPFETGVTTEGVQPNVEVEPKQEIVLDSTSILRVTSPPTTTQVALVSTALPQRPKSPLDPEVLEMAKKMLDERSKNAKLPSARASVITKKEGSSNDTEVSIINPTPAPPENSQPAPVLSIPASLTVIEVPFATGKGNNRPNIEATSGPGRSFSPDICSLGESRSRSPVPIGSTTVLESSTTTITKTTTTTTIRGDHPATNPRNQSRDNTQPAHGGSHPSPCPKQENQGLGKVKYSFKISGEMDPLKKNTVYQRVEGSPSPFLPTRKIYGDPKTTLRSAQQKSPNPTPRSNGLSNYNGRGEEEALDFSCKRQKLMSGEPYQQSSQNHVTVPILDGGGCLDLSLRRGQQSSSNARPVPDLPPPNAVHQNGVKLTSEVTLFPSPQHQKKSRRGGSPQVQMKKTSRVSATPNEAVSPHYSPHPPYVPRPFLSDVPAVELNVNPFPRPATATSSRQRFTDPPSQQPNRGSEFVDVPQTIYAGAGRSVSGTNHQGNQSNMAANNRGWRSSVPSATVSSHAQAPAQVTSPNSTGRAGKNRGTFPIPMSTPSLSHHHGSFNNHQGSKPSTVTLATATPENRAKYLPLFEPITPPTPKQSPLHGLGIPAHGSSLTINHQRYRHPSETGERNRALTLDHLGPSSTPVSYGSFAPGFTYAYPNLDPAFFSSPFANPFAMNPNLMRLPPGSLESIQMAAYLQQGLSGQAAHLSNWAPPEDSRNGGRDSRNGGRESRNGGRDYRNGGPDYRNGGPE